MDQRSGVLALPLDPISPLLPLDEPFTPAGAAVAGIGRAALDRLHREGRVRRLLRGVYVGATAPDGPRLRTRAVALVVGDGQVVRGRTAAWLHGAPGWPGAAPVPVETHGPARSAPLASHDLAEVGGVRCTTPLRTALDLGSTLPADRALAALDGLLGLGSFTHAALMAELPRFGGRPGVGQLRELAAIADARAAGPAESVLRLRWHCGRLPTPVPGLLLDRPGRPLRLALGLETHRFGVVLGEPVRPGPWGWRVVELSTARVLHGDPMLLAAHLEREFHGHLLDQVGA